LKITVAVILAVAVTLGLVFIVGARFRAGASGPGEPTAVKVEPVARGDLVEVVVAPGEIQPLKKVDISAKVAAPIVEMPHKEGEQVYGPGPSTQPSLLVQLDDKDLQAIKRQVVARERAQEEQANVAVQRITAQRATVRAARATLADLERDLKRNKELLGTHDVSQSVVDTAQSKYDEQIAQIESTEAGIVADEINLKVMAAELEAARAEVAKADEDISYTTIKSPIDGMLTSVKAEVGEMVVTGTMNNPGTVIVQVADLSQMLMVAHIDETQIAAVKEGQRATIRIQAYRDKIFTGTVQTVAQTRTEDKTDMTRYFEAKVLLDLKGDRIRSGLSADAEIETDRHSNVLRVPSQSVVGRPVDQLPEEMRKSPLIEKGKTIATVVYRIIDGKAVVTPVSVGPSDDTHTLIAAGLKEGDSVVVGPFKVLESLADGQLVKSDGPAATTQPTTKAAAAPETRMTKSE
jgi:HlyD family secretion protein